MFSMSSPTGIYLGSSSKASMFFKRSFCYFLDLTALVIARAMTESSTARRCASSDSDYGSVALILRNVVKTGAL